MTIVYDSHGVLARAPNGRVPAEQPADHRDPGTPVAQPTGTHPHPG